MSDCARGDPTSQNSEETSEAIFAFLFLRKKAKIKQERIINYMGKAPAFQFYAADFFMDTNSWTPSQVGAYCRLLMYEWVNGSLPAQIGKLARIAGIDPRNMQKMWSAEIAKKFTTDGAGMLVNLRLEEERQKQLKYRELQSERGKIGAEKRWNPLTDAIAPAITPAKPTPQPEDSSSVFSLQSSNKELNKVADQAGGLPSNSPEDLIQAVSETDELCEKLTKCGKFPEAYEFRGWCLKKGLHLLAIRHAFRQIAKKEPWKDIDLWAYGVKIVRVESQNYTERDHLAKHQKLKEKELRECLS